MSYFHKLSYYFQKNTVNRCFCQMNIFNLLFPCLDGDDGGKCMKLCKCAAAFAVCIRLCHPGQRQGASLCRQTMMTASKQQHHRLASSTAVLTEEGGAKKSGGENCETEKGNSVIAGD